MPVEKEKIFGAEEAVARIGLEFLSPEDESMPTLSDLTPKEVFLFTCFKSIANFYKSDIMNSFILYFLRFRVSRLRIGRREMLLLASGIRELEEERRKSTQMKSLLSGLG